MFCDPFYNPFKSIFVFFYLLSFIFSFFLLLLRLFLFCLAEANGGLRTELIWFLSHHSRAYRVVRFERWKRWRRRCHIRKMSHGNLVVDLIDTGGRSLIACLFGQRRRADHHLLLAVIHHPIGCAHWHRTRVVDVCCR